MIVVKPIPLDKVKPPYNELILSLQELAVEITTDIDSEVLSFFVEHSLESWNTILHWVTKLKWNSKLKIPGGRIHAQATKPWGELYYRLLELCIQSHAGVGYERANYPDASIWFRHIWDESLLLGIQDELALISGLKDPEKENKKVRVAGIRQALKALRNFQNPYDPAERPHLHHLIQYSICLAEKSDEFRKEYWNPYIRALANCATQLNENSKGYYQAPVIRVEEVGGRQILRVYKREGSGKSLKCIFENQRVAETLAP